MAFFDLRSNTQPFLKKLRLTIFVSKSYVIYCMFYTGMVASYICCSRGPKKMFWSRFSRLFLSVSC